MSVTEARRSAASESRVDDVYRILHRAITEQALRPGTKLPEDTIGQHLGVSRTIVRAAITRLQASGLVQVQHNRGASVAIPSLEEAEQVFVVRRSLEREAMRLLAGRLGDAAIAELEAHLETELAAQRAPNEHDSIRLAGAFHVLLASLTGNAVLTGFIEDLVSRCSLILAVYARPHSAECAVAEHRQVIEALRLGDADRAIAVMDHHLESVERRAFRAQPTQAKDLGAILSRYA